jgi:hypothetical protein
MAVVDPTFSEIVSRGDHGHVVSWGTLGTSDVGAAIEMIGSARRTVQVIGSLSPSNKVVIEGSNNGVDYATLSDIHGNALEFRGVGISTVADLTRWIRPRVLSGSPAATVVMLMRKTEAR